MFSRRTAFDRAETEKKSGSDYTLKDLPVKPGSGVYATTLQVEFYCRGGGGTQAIPADGDTPARPGLRDYEALNIRCQNVIWAAYLVVLDIAEDPKFAQESGLELIETLEGMEFDNTRGHEFPLTEYGTFSFHAFVG